MDVPRLHGNSGIGAARNCSGAAADKRALIIAPTAESGGFYYSVFNSNLGGISGRLHRQEFFFIFFFLADKMEKEGEEGVMAGNGERQIFPTQLKSESWKMKPEKKRKKGLKCRRVSFEV